MENKLQHTSATTREFTLRFLEQITDNFSKEHIIGRGGYGVVYKGVLENGEEIALKKFHLMPGLDDNPFRTELNILRRAQHKNIVRLVGYCYDIGHQPIKYNGEYIFAHVEERVLGFEYLHGGSLDMYISDESNGLDWHTRYKIIRGVCEGLNYLHNGFKDPIYHLDLKPANILLDKNMVPKIGDFGLSRLFPTAQTYTTRQIRGTFGYLPPEYIGRCTITSKHDVFSLGVIIIRIMAGDEGFSKCADMSSQEFIEHVHENWRKRLKATMWPHTSQEIKTCIEIALRCVEADQVKRPTIAEIVDELVITNFQSTEAFNQQSKIDDQALELEALERILIDASAEPVMLSYTVLKKITNDFSQVIGSGGFGVVYMGVVQNMKVAVKKLSRIDDFSENQFEEELRCFIRVKHKNIVRFLGYCSDTQRQVVTYNGQYVIADMRQRLLCFEYVPNKSLHDYLKDESYGREWSTPYQLIKGICQGLRYLHNEQRITHLDLKPDNILLDANMVPKITDFGLSRRFSGEQSKMITKNIFGAWEYLAPEYRHKGEISFKSDIFSLGTIIIKLLRGRNDLPDAREWHESLEIDCPQVKRCIEIAQMCVDEEQHKRPTIDYIIDKLNEKETI